MNKTTATIALALWAALTAGAQTTDKADADALLFDMLKAQNRVENFHQPLDTAASKLLPTAEQGIYTVQGSHFQVESLRSDYYVQQTPQGLKPVASAKLPMETAVNLLLNRLADNRHQLRLTHHQYGGRNPKLTIPMQALYDALARTTDIYCSVTQIDSADIKATLVFHHRGRNYIHMLQLNIPTRTLLTDSTIEADMYSNIPQDNIKSLFKKK